MNSSIIILVALAGLLQFVVPNAYAEEFQVSIPFGAFDPTFETPVDNWYEPPVVFIQEGDTVIWTNNDREGHTVTSGKGAGRFGWMGGDKFGEPDGYFDKIHPWMEGVVFVGKSIPEYPHDAEGNKIEQFPVLEYTTDGLIELDMTWEPNVIMTHDEVSFIYQTYDPMTNLNLDKMKYDFIIIQNGEELFRDKGLTGIGGDYRNFIFDKPGAIEIRFENIESGGTSGIESVSRLPMTDPSLRTVVFSTMVYDNLEKQAHHEIVIQPAKRVELQYELLVAIITVPGALAIVAVLYMMYGKPKKNTNYG